MYNYAQIEELNPHIHMKNRALHSALAKLEIIDERKGTNYHKQ